MRKTKKNTVVIKKSLKIQQKASYQVVKEKMLLVLYSVCGLWDRILKLNFLIKAGNLKVERKIFD